MPNKRSNFNTGLPTKEGDEIYARAKLPAGNSQFRVIPIDTGSKEVTATIRGSLRKGGKNKVKPEMLVLLQPDESSTKEKWFIIHVYSDDDVKRLRKSGEIVDIKEKEVSNVVFVDDSVPNAASNEESDEDDQDFIDDI